jgi:threonine aldolase
MGSGSVGAKGRAMTNFCSDNTTGASPEILDALARASAGQVMPYGNDDLTRRVEARFRQVFETDCAVFPVATGTAGAKLVALDGAHGKLTPEILAGAVEGAGVVHHVQPAAFSLTQATEAGTLYRPAEVAAIGALARHHGLGLQMDGARFANAVAALGCSPAEITWRAGVHALAFGATKNGALAAEAVVLFKPELAESFGYRRKRGGHLFSKMRFLSAQLEAYLENDLWLANARHANAQAARLAEGLAALPGARLLHPVEANEIFAVLPAAVIEGLLAEGFQFYRWGPEAQSAVRLVTAFNTRPGDVAAFLAAARRLAGGQGRKRA